MRYSESLGKKPVFWNVELSKADRDIDWNDLEDKAGDFEQCAVGNESHIIPRNHVGTPDDEYLMELGLMFEAAIVGHKKDDALAVLRRIKVRASIVEAQTKRELKKKAKILV
jgi:hypothetical protein